MESEITQIYAERNGESRVEGGRALVSAKNDCNVTLKCKCGNRPKLMISRTENNPERKFWGCPHTNVSEFYFSIYNNSKLCLGKRI